MKEKKLVSLDSDWIFVNLPKRRVGRSVWWHIENGLWKKVIQLDQWNWQVKGGYLLETTPKTLKVKGLFQVLCCTPVVPNYIKTTLGIMRADIIGRGRIKKCVWYKRSGILYSRLSNSDFISDIALPNLPI